MKNNDYANFTKIGNIAKIFLQKYYKSVDKELELPIDIAKIVHYLGYTTEFRKENQNILAYTDMIQKKIVIFINPSDLSLKFRLRFTIAHEIGHIILHEKQYVKQLNLVENNVEMLVNNIKLEREADIFASHILLPRQKVKEKVVEFFGEKELFFKKDILQPRISKAIISYVKQLAQASESAVIIALRDCKIIKY